MRAELAARCVSPTLGVGFVDLALGVELILSESGLEPSTFASATGGHVGAGILFAAVGVFTFAGVIADGHARMAALMANVMLWTFVTVTTLQASPDPARLFGPTITAGFALISALRFVQLKWLPRR